MITPRTTTTASRQDIPIFIAHNHNHFSYIHRQQAQQILEQRIGKSPRRFADYRTSVHDCQEFPFVTHSTARSIPLNRRCGRVHADKAIVDLLRQLIFPTRHVPSDNFQSHFPRSNCSCKPEDDWDDGDDDEGNRPYGYVYGRLAPTTQCWIKDCCQYGVVLGYIGVLALCRLLGGGCHPHRNGSRITLRHQDPYLINCLPAEAPPAGKEPGMRSASLLGAVGASPAPTTKMPFTCSASEYMHNQQLPRSQNGNRTVKASFGVGVCLILGLMGSLLGMEANSCDDFLSQTYGKLQFEQSPLTAETVSLSCGSCPDPSHWYENWVADGPHEPRIDDTPWESRHGKACGRTAWYYLGLAHSHRFWGGALRRVGLFCCSGLACVDIHAEASGYHFMQLCVENVGVHACAGQDASCSFGLNNSQATNCLSIGKFF